VICSPIIRAEPAMQPRKAVMRAIHGSPTLDGVTQAIAMATGEKPSGPVELGNAPAAMDAVGPNITDEPGSLTAEAAVCPTDWDLLGD
jgi:hypothetical protein